jgi:hypothetical protein
VDFGFCKRHMFPDGLQAAFVDLDFSGDAGAFGPVSVVKEHYD